MAKPLCEKMIDNAKRSRDEAEVAGLWNEMLHDIGLNTANGYMIIPEKRLHSNRRPDLVVRVILSDMVVLIVECKCIEYDSMEGWDSTETQLNEYLQQAGCRNGIAAIGHKCKFLNLREPFILQRKTYDWSNEFQQIIEILVTFTRTGNFEP